MSYGTRPSFLHEMGSGIETTWNLGQVMVRTSTSVEIEVATQLLTFQCIEPVDEIPSSFWTNAAAQGDDGTNNGTQQSKMANTPG